MTATSSRILGVIGTADRDKNIEMNNLTWRKMTIDFSKRVRPEDTLVSGGAAWADHLAVYAYLNGLVSGLQLFLPAPFKDGKFQGPAQSAGSAANYYHGLFKLRAGVDSLSQLAQAIDKGAVVSEEPAEYGHRAMFIRNSKVAKCVTAVVAYTFGYGDAPTSSGTLHTWNLIKVTDKTHVDISNIQLK